MRASAAAWWVGAALWFGLAQAGSAEPAQRSALGVAADTSVQAPMSPEAGAAWQAVLETADNAGLPYAIVDKREARLFLFDGAGRPLASTRVLLGQAVGDRSIPDIAVRDVSRLRPEERITPAGRFESQPGHNIHGEDIVWVDYAAAVAIHRLRPADPRQRRPERLASASAADKRISLGCVVVPVAFYEQFVRPLLGRTRGVVYVLPEAGSVRDGFPLLARMP